MVVALSSIRHSAISCFLATSATSATSTNNSRCLFARRQLFQSTSPNAYMMVMKGYTMIMKKGRNVELADMAGNLIGNMPDMERPVPESLLPHPNKSFSWEEYLLARGYFVEEDYRSAPAKAQRSAVIWYSNMLTYPLTLAGAWKTLGLHHSKHPMVCAVGAEMELYVQGLWRETAHIVGSRFDLMFVGDLVADPEEIPRMKDHYHDDIVDNYLTLNPKEDPYVSLHYETTLVEEMMLDWKRMDAFLCFHPGAGMTANEDYSWEQGLSILRKTEKPMLLTAYNQEDAMRDRNWWIDKFRGEQLLYKKNPWQSMRDVEKGAMDEIPYNSYYVCYMHGKKHKGPGRVE